MKNQNIKQTSNFVEINGVGTICGRQGYFDTYIYGYFTKWRWKFIVHASSENPEWITVSEASTGYRLQNDTYYNVEDALYFALSFLEEKHYYLATRIGDVLVSNQCNLTTRNVGVRTPALDSLLWKG